jgi:cytoskeletal protein RodZ
MMDFLSTMDLSLLALLVGILFLGASVLFGWMLFYFARSREKGTSRRPQAGPSLSPTASPPITDGKVQRKPELEEAEPSLPEQQSTFSEVGHQASAASEVLRLLRDRDTGALIVEVKGEKYRALREIKDERIGRQVLQAAANLVHFTGVIQAHDRARTSQPSSLSAAEPTATDSPPALSTVALEEAPPVPRTPAPPSVEREFLQSLVQQRLPKEEETRKASLSPIEFFRRSFSARRRARVQGDIPSPLSFVEEIEEILQRFLRTYPSFIGKEVHVGTAQSGGIRIQVEDEFYDTPDDIPDPEIRGILKAAIQEWEKS